MKVFVVTEGEYSDYHIEGIFSTKEYAQAFIEASSKTDYKEWWTPEIEEWEMDEHQGKIPKDTFCVGLDLETGAVRSRCKEIRIIKEHDDHEIAARYCDTIIVASTISEEHALKIAAEQRQAYLRETVGGQDAPLD